MSDKKISELAASTTPLAGTEALPIVQSGATKQVSVANLTAGRSFESQAHTVKLLADGNAFILQDSTGATKGQMQLNAGDLTIGTGVIGVKFYDFANAIAPVGADTGSFRDNAVDLGASISQWRDIYLKGNVIIGTAGKGIDFSGVGTAARILDDYEEGTYTPALSGNTTAGTYTYSERLGYYTKVGNQVTVYAQLAGINATSAGTGVLRVSLPLAYKANSAFDGAVATGVIDLDADTMSLSVARLTGASLTNLSIVQTRDNLAATQIDISTVGANAFIRFTATYTVA